MDLIFPSWHSGYPTMRCCSTLLPPAEYQNYLVISISTDLWWKPAFSVKCTFFWRMNHLLRKWYEFSSRALFLRDFLFKMPSHNLMGVVVQVPQPPALPLPAGLWLDDVFCETPELSCSPLSYWKGETYYGRMCQTESLPREQSERAWHLSWSLHRKSQW